jgi:hypothetical protein
MSPKRSSPIPNGKGGITFIRPRRVMTLYDITLADLARTQTAKSRVVRVDERERVLGDTENEALRNTY